MLTREVLEAQLTLYREGQGKAMVRLAQAEHELDEAKVNLAGFAGAIDSCENFLRILTQLEEARKQEKPPQYEQGE